ncbi:hypothetical protein BVRB_5g103520 [Beta vulgaris subsp. vulgaris]|nr:uncharacterized protein LOC104892574 isoform X2 [Beta vulgaris subsp. vulgaris]KMT12420.1 hypothetical protein BVRB_5g103520 [Beta vulgaris subsp. vulgaris]
MATSSASESTIAVDEIPEVVAPPSIPSSSSFFDGWKERIFYPTLLGGIVGGAVGAVSKHRKVHGLANISATYATNFAIVAGCYCGAREFVRVTRKSEPDDLVNSALGGFCSGALLGRLQGGQRGAIRYSIMFAIAGTAADFAVLELQPLVKNYYDSLLGSDFKLPEWSPIRILDEEALAAKQAREEELRAQRAIIMRGKET